jgi:hypothetical protein
MILEKNKTFVLKMLKNFLIKTQYIKPTLNFETITNNFGRNKTPRTPYFEPLYDGDKPGA